MMAVDAIGFGFHFFLARIGGHNQIPFQDFFAIQEHERSVICPFF
jgi:hypothetical protein